MAIRQACHFQYGDGAKAIAGSSYTVAPANSLIAWLTMIFLTKSWYSAGCCSISAGVLTTNGAAVVDTACS